MTLVDPLKSSIQTPPLFPPRPPLQQQIIGRSSSLLLLALGMLTWVGRRRGPPSGAWSSRPTSTPGGPRASSPAPLAPTAPARVETPLTTTARGPPPPVLERSPECRRSFAPRSLRSSRPSSCPMPLAPTTPSSTLVLDSST